MEECSIKIWILGLRIELASYKPRMDPVLKTIIAILLPVQNVELSSSILLKPSHPQPSTPPTQTLFQTNISISGQI